MSEPNLFESMVRDIPEEDHYVRLWFSLLGCFTGIERALRRRFRKEFDSSLPRFDVLTALITFSQGLTMTELATKLGVSKGNVTGVVGRLRNDGLVDQTRQEDDRRVQLVVITDAGKAQWETMQTQYREVVEKILAELAEKDADNLTEGLLGLQQLIDHATPVDQ